MRGSRRPVASTNGSARALPAANSARPANATRMDIEPRGRFMLAPLGAHGRNLYRPKIVFGEPAATKLRGALQSKTRRVESEVPNVGEIRRLALLRERSRRQADPMRARRAAVT